MKSIHWVLGVEILVNVLCTSHGFLPTTTQADAWSQSHHTITERAVHAIVDQLVTSSTAVRHLPDRATILGSRSFREALKKLKDGASWPDFDPVASTDPKIHFDDEEIVEAGERLRQLRLDVVREIQSGKMGTARWLAGRALHSLQDFYSHSNWIEMGNREPYADLGVRPIAFSQVATRELATCVPCITSGSTVNCTDNIIEEVNSNHILTSGYADLFGSKPEGKCSHGGQNIGGINKCSVKRDVAPHHFLHEQAADTAVEASVKFLESIRHAVLKPNGSHSMFPDEDFVELLGITSHSDDDDDDEDDDDDNDNNNNGAVTLCFIVDTTGSMGGEIAAVREQTIRMTRQVRNPSDYVLSPFNDPGYGPVFKTTNATAMIAALSALRATGGGDGPELAFHGIQLALQNVRVGSTCYFFTDAPAKDRDLYSTVKSLAIEKRVTIHSMLTDVTPSGRRRRSARRQKRSASYYQSLSESTGGLTLYVRKSDISQVLRIIEMADAPNLQVPIFHASSRANAFSFNVDGSVRSVTVQIADSANSLRGMTVTSPDGREARNGTQFLSLSSLQVYNISRPRPGVWNVNVLNSGGAFSAVVAATTKLSFTYRFAVLRPGPHGGYAPISGNPVAGSTYYILVTTYGGRDETTGLSTGLVRNITSLKILSTSGDALMTLPAFALQPLKLYGASLVLPDTEFRVGLEGEDATGNRIQRVDEKVMSAATVRLIINVRGNSSYTVLPGRSVTVSVNVTHVGRASSWYIRVSDSSNFYTGISPIVYL